MSIWKFASVLALSAGISTSVVAETHSGGILGAAGVNLAASSEIEIFICPYNEEGGMISEIVAASLGATADGSDNDWDFIQNPLTLDLSEVAKASRIVFPMYKPRCDNRALLNQHTEALCNDFVWSDPLFHVIMSGYVAADRGWSPRNNNDLIGRTVCQPAGEVSYYLRERGITDLNARIVTAPTPSACLKLVTAGESDIAIMPMVSAEPALDNPDLGVAIRHVPALDMALSMHAVAGAEQINAVDQIATLNVGLANIQGNGSWFEIVKEHHGGHSHDTHHHAHVTD